jgi:hypothetical protein
MVPLTPIEKGLERAMRGLCAIVTAATLAICSMAEAAPRGGMRFWNLTLYTLTSLQFSLPGKNEWAPNQCLNDNDGTVDHDERLSVTGLVPGLYDGKLTDKAGRTCIVKNVVVTQGIFAIEEKQLTDCQQK